MKYLNLPFSRLWTSKPNENHLRLFNATAARARNFPCALELLRLQSSRHSIAMINGFLFFSGRWCIGKTLFLSANSLGMINSSNVASALAPGTQKVGLWASKEGLNWVMPPPCAADLHFIYRTCSCTSLRFCDYVTSCMRVHNSILDCVFLVTLDSPACTL